MALNLSIYSIDFSKVAERLTPWFWRYPIYLSYLKAALDPLQTINDTFYQYVSTTWGGLQYTGQHLALEALLNDEYDPTQRRIYIDENDITFVSLDLYLQGETDPSPTSLYLQGETNPSPIILYLQGEGVGGENFTVNIPAGVTYTEDILRSRLSIFVLAGKSYNIVTF